MKNQNVYKNLMIVLITAIISLLLATAFVYNYTKGVGGTKYVYVGTQNSTSLDRAIQGIRDVVDKYYFGDIPEESKLVEGAIKGYVEALGDEYTEYMSASDWSGYKESVLGNYTGLGVYLRAVEKGQEIVAIIEDSPAHNNELEIGDIITKVDDMIATKENGKELTDYIKNGKNGTKYSLEVLRGDEIIKKEIISETVRLVQIQAKMIEDNIGYMKFSTFDMDCAQDFRKKYQKLVDEGAKGIVIDLRNNTGGVLTEALSVAEMLLDKNAIMLVSYDKQNGETIYKSKTDKEFNLPLVVLTNKYSASASEVLVGALKDNNRATILGTTTYGKGVMQDVLTLSNGGSLKMTTQEFLTPNRNKINKTGIEPDVILDIPEEYSNIAYVPEGEDNQLQKAVELLK